MFQLVTKTPAASLLALFTVTLSVPNPIPGSENIVVRDPAIWYRSNSKTYFVFSTGGTIQTFTSSSLSGPWTTDAGMALSQCSKIPKPGNCSIWAPDVNFVNSTYVLYYSVSTSGSNNSAIGVATSPSMDPGSWNDLGGVISSNNDTVYNAIDGNLIDADGLRLTFGSYRQGIFQLPLGDIHSIEGATPGTHLAGGNKQPSEGAFTYKPQGSKFFYLFFSHGTTPIHGDPTRPPPGQEYRVLVGRSESVSGPFVDKDGHDLTEIRNPPAGSLVLGTHDNIYAPGGQSVYRDPVSGRDVMVYHYVRRNEKPGGYSYLGINYLDFSSGWPLVVE